MNLSGVCQGYDRYGNGERCKCADGLKFVVVDTLGHAEERLLCEICREMLLPPAKDDRGGWAALGN